MIVDPDFSDHWKTRLLVDTLTDEAAPVYLLRIWAHCQHRRTHVFPSLTPNALKALCRFPGAADLLESALLASGFIRREAGALVVHQWEEYNSSLIANWENGKKGGRPKSNGNPNETHGLARVNPSQTHAEPIDRIEKRGEERKPAGGEPAAQKARKEATGDHADFIRRWMAEYPKHHGGETYLLHGQKDGTHVSQLLKACAKTPEEWQAMFITAWQHPELFNCKQATSITGFVGRFNEIRTELNGLKPSKATPPDYLKTEWPEWLKAKGHPFAEYQFAAEFLKTDFHRDRKAKAA